MPPLPKQRLEDMTEPELAAVMRTIAKTIEATCELIGVEKPLFCLLLFNDPKVAQYIGNCDRSDMIRAMRECAARLQSRQDVTR